MKCALEVRVEHVEEPIGKPPKEEQNSDLKKAPSAVRADKSGKRFLKQFRAGKYNVPRAFGNNDCRKVRFTAEVTASSWTVIFLLYKPMAAGFFYQKTDSSFVAVLTSNYDERACG